MNRKQILVILWIVLVLGGLSGISYHRQKYFEDHLENNITELTKDMEERSFELEERWESLDKSNPGKISHTLNQKLFSVIIRISLIFIVICKIEKIVVSF